MARGRSPRLHRGPAWQSTGFSEVDVLAEQIAEVWRERGDLFREFREVLSALGLVEDVAIEVYQRQPSRTTRSGSGEIAEVLFDGKNLGLCSDGTLRIARIALELLRPQASCLVIEEPETAVHPGLLDKLLALVDAYSIDRQIILSTHSPQVVDHFSPGQLRLVEREQGVTRVHALSAADRDLAIAYLHDRGALSDFVFRRSET